MGKFSNKIKREKLIPGDHIYTRRFGYSHHGIYIGGGYVIHFTRESGQQRCPVASQSMNFAGFRQKLHGVVQCSLDSFLSGGELYRFKYAASKITFHLQGGGTCTLAPADPPQDVLHRAGYLLEHGFGVYDLIKNNCEDFAVYCKTGLVLIPTKSRPEGRSGSLTDLWAKYRPVGRSGQLTSLWVGTTHWSHLIVWPILGSVWHPILVIGVFVLPVYLVSSFIKTHALTMAMDMGVSPHVAKVPVELLDCKGQCVGHKERI